MPRDSLSARGASQIGYRWICGWLAAFVLLAVLPSAGVGAGPELRKVDVFAAGSNGYEIYRIPGLVVTAKGTLLAYAEARRSGSADWGAIDIALRRSTDGGKTWSPQQVIANVAGEKTKNPVGPAQRSGDPEAVTYNNPIAIADPKTGAVHFLFCLEYLRAFYMRSDDDGRTFSEPVEITSAFEGFRAGYDWKVIATGPGHGIQLKNGRLVVPVWLALGTGGNAHRPSVASTIYSDDAGATWHAGEIAVPNTEVWVNASETVAEQLADGRVMLNVRTESKANRRLITSSADGATGWSVPRFQEELKEPICFGSMVRLSGAGDGRRNRLLFVNPDNLLVGAEEGKPGRGRDRKNLTVQLSYDEGATWAVKRVVEPGWSGYADINVGKDGRIHLLYERGNSGDDRFRVAALTLATFDLKWLTKGNDRQEWAR
jgi:sialidase-1